MKMSMKVFTVVMLLVMSLSMTGMAPANEPALKMQPAAVPLFDNRDDDKGDNLDAADPELVNTQEWSISDISAIEASYGTDIVTVLPSPTQQIILKEYMSEDSAAYYAKTSVSGATLKIESGARPDAAPNGYSSYAQLYLPTDYSGTLKLQTRIGIISVSGVSVSKLTAQCQNGSINVSNFNGELDCKIQIGDVHVSESAIKGSVCTQNGVINLNVSDILGDLNVFTRIGVITAALPKTATFTITASTDIGEITNQFSNNWTVDDKTVNRSTLTGTWGEKPQHEISLVSNNGTIDIKLADNNTDAPGQ